MVVTNVSSGHGQQIGELTAQLNQMENPVKTGGFGNSRATGGEDKKRIGFLETSDMVPEAFDGKI